MQRDDVEGAFFVAFNASHTVAVATLPDFGCRWDLVCDTAKPAPYDFITPDVPQLETAMAQTNPFLYNNVYPLLPYSSIILKANYA